MADDETPDEELDELLDLRPTGLVRIFIDGKRYRLRRPFFGELKALRMAVERVEDEIGDLRDGAAKQAREIGEEAKAAAEDTDLSDDERQAVTDKLTRRGREVGRDLIDAADELRLDWWRQVFATVSLDGTPDPMPGWIVDPALAPKVMNHWRTAPFRSVV